MHVLETQIKLYLNSELNETYFAFWWNQAVNYGCTMYGLLKNQHLAIMSEIENTKLICMDPKTFNNSNSKL